MRSITLCILICSAYLLQGQSRVVINNDAYLVMQNGVSLVVDNAAVNAVATAGSGGNIVSESETNILKWMIGSGSGNYTIPFTTSSGIKIPLSMAITTPGTGAGNITFSTYGNANWNNDLYKPTGVSNMTNMGVTNNSSEVIDRFWIMDAQGYTTKPGGTIQFGYDDAEHSAAGNTITEADLKAERYDAATNNWETFPVGGIINTASNYVAAVPFNTTDFARVWTLIDQTTHLLPITVTSFTVNCGNDATILQWETANEIGTDYFILSGSIHGDDFQQIGIIAAAENSTSLQSYTYSIDASFYKYYKLNVVYTDGNEEMVGIQTAACGLPANAFQVYSPAAYTINIETMLPASEYTLEIYSVNGQLIGGQHITLNGSAVTIQYTNTLLSAGMYIVKLTDMHHPDMQLSGKTVLTY